MANRAAIRELQTRLAARLQAARTEGGSVSWLAVRAGSKNYLFPLVQSGEIFSMGALQRVPYCKPWFRGVLNLRGGLFGVVDLAAFITDGPVPVRSELAASEASVVTLHSALEINCALLVDALAGLRNLDSFTRAEVPSEGQPPFFGNLYTDGTGASWQEINLQTLAQVPGFLNVGS